MSSQEMESRVYRIISKMDDGLWYTTQELGTTKVNMGHIWQSSLGKKCFNRAIHKMVKNYPQYKYSLRPDRPKFQCQALDEVISGMATLGAQNG